MLIQHKDEIPNGSFFVEEEGKQLAEMTYSISGEDIMIIDHTAVDAILKGKNTGNLLLDHAVVFARTNHLKIIALCPFVKSVFQTRHEVFKDVMKI